MNSLVYLLLAYLAALSTVQCQDMTLPPQCDLAEVVTPSDILFLGPVKSIQAGNITFSYHEFGPLGVAEVEAAAFEEQQEEEEEEQEEVLDNDGTVLPTNEASSSSPPESDSDTLVLVHGFASTQYDWPAALLEELAHSRRVIIFDNPRIGASVDISEEVLTIEYMANATVAFIEALGLVKPHVLGYSMGGDIVLTAAVLHPDKLGAIISVAGSFGGPLAPVPPTGLDTALGKLALLFLAKYSSFAPSEDSQEQYQTQSQSYVFDMEALSSGGGASASENETAIGLEDFKLFFPLGLEDPGACKFLNADLTIRYAVGLPIGGVIVDGSGFALPGNASDGRIFSEGIIPSIEALIPAPATLMQQALALLSYHAIPSIAAAGLTNTTKHILFLSGSQDNVIPVTTQIEASKMTPGSWLVQIPNAGHAVPFTNPTGLANVVSQFLDGATDISPEVKSYYYTPTSGAGTMINGARNAIIIVLVSLLSTFGVML